MKQGPGYKAIRLRAHPEQVPGEREECITPECIESARVIPSCDWNANDVRMSEQSGLVNRRRFLGVCSAVGLGQTLLPGLLWGMAAQAGPSSANTENTRMDSRVNSCV